MPALLSGAFMLSTETMTSTSSIPAVAVSQSRERTASSVSLSLPNARGEERSDGRVRTMLLLVRVPLRFGVAALASLERTGPALLPWEMRRLRVCYVGVLFFGGGVKGRDTKVMSHLHPPTGLCPPDLRLTKTHTRPRSCPPSTRGTPQSAPCSTACRSWRC